MKYHIDPSKLAIHNKHVKRQDFHKNGQLGSEKYLINGELHNPNGPAFCWWSENGQLRWESYWINGVRHRSDGPAIQEWSKGGLPLRAMYILNGTIYSKENYDNLVK